MQYLVRLTNRALRDLEDVYQSIEADASARAFAWFNGLTEAVYSLEELPDRGSVIPENKKLRHLHFGNKPHVYRIIYAVDKRNRIVNVLHIRHSARDRFSAE